jgi:ribonuclease BN (tRNA processing enzyme)
MKLTFIGSADAFNSGGRGHSCYWLDGAADEPVIVDFGGTSLMKLRLEGLDPDALGAVVLTHLHGDHFGGLPFLQIHLTFVSQRTRPLVIVGPPGTRDRVNALIDLVYGPSIAEHAQFDIEFVEIGPGESAEVLGSRWEAFYAVHLEPPDMALCLRMTAKDGTVIAFSGDTEPCDGLLDSARGSDLLVAECTGMRPPMGPHMTWAEWPGLLAKLETRRVALTHLGQDVREELPAILEKGGLPGAPLVLADDGLVLQISPAD